MSTIEEVQAKAHKRLVTVVEVVTAELATNSLLGVKPSLAPLPILNRVRDFKDELDLSCWDDLPLEHIQAYFGKDLADVLVQEGHIKPFIDADPPPASPASPAPTAPVAPASSQDEILALKRQVEALTKEIAAKNAPPQEYTSRQVYSCPPAPENTSASPVQAIPSSWSKTASNPLRAPRASIQASSSKQYRHSPYQGKKPQASRPAHPVPPVLPRYAFAPKPLEGEAPPPPDWSYDFKYKPTPAVYQLGNGAKSSGMINLQRLSGGRHRDWDRQQLGNPRFCHDYFCTESGCYKGKDCYNRHYPPTSVEAAWLKYHHLEFFSFMEWHCAHARKHYQGYETRLFNKHTATEWGLVSPPASFGSLR
ncbi:hypothetical protein CC80DRAFT_544048 [Byssothecium circinans]|uniref:Uncharacterized protein n=1 Tax=Byssothecium circinans TaxID=147558 RepID=A0A6A5U9Y6_9PLEO|nr:hypothetical protein CC80DRAFT_544048 [Byssothecium circinans]